MCPGVIQFFKAEVGCLEYNLLTKFHFQGLFVARMGGILTWLFHILILFIHCCILYPCCYRLFRADFLVLERFRCGQNTFPEWLLIFMKALGVSTITSKLNLKLGGGLEKFDGFFTFITRDDHFVRISWFWGGTAVLIMFSLRDYRFFWLQWVIVLSLPI